MVNLKLKPKMVRAVCNNCLKETACLRNENGQIRFRCSCCGSKTFSNVKGRRHVQIDIYAPDGQTLINED